MTENKEKLKEENDVTERKNDKKEKKKTGKGKIAVIFFIIIAVIGAAFYAVPTIMSRMRENVSETGENVVTDLNTENSGSVFSVDSGEIKSLSSISGTGIMTTSNSLISFGKNGSVISSVKTGYSSACVRCAEKKYICFERSTGKYSIMDENGTLYSSKLDGEIISADISRSGGYVIISRKNLSTSVVTVYSSDNEVLFQWECSEGYLTDCIISQNGKKIAVSSFDIENGNECSRIYSFTVKSVDVEKEFRINSSVIYAMRFLNGNTVGAVTSGEYFIADLQSGETKEISFDYDTISGCVFGANNNAAILKSDFGSLDMNKIVVYNRSGEEICSREIEGKILDFACDKSFIYIMTPGKVTKYAISTGEEYSAVDTAGGLRYMEVISGKIFCASDTELFRYTG